MKAIVMTVPGAAEVLQLREVPTPVAQGREVRVRLHAAGINPVDTKLRQRGTYFPQGAPAILGCDGAGIVDAVGPDATRYGIGDAVYFCNGGIGGHAGNYAEYAVIDERFAAPKPASLSFAQAAAGPLALITAWESLHDRGALRAGQTVLIHAGAGGVGHLAIQLARLHGARVCTTVSGADKRSFVTDLGAERVIDYREEDFVAAVNEWSEGGVDLALDTVGGEVLKRTVFATRHYGDLVTLLAPGDDMNWNDVRARNLRVTLELMLVPMASSLTGWQQHHGEILQRCAQLFDSGKLRIHLAKTFGLAQAADAHRLLEAGAMTGKIVLVMVP